MNHIKSKERTQTQSFLSVCRKLEYLKGKKFAEAGIPHHYSISEEFDRGYADEYARQQKVNHTAN